MRPLQSPRGRREGPRSSWKAEHLHYLQQFSLKIGQAWCQCTHSMGRDISVNSDPRAHLPVVREGTQICERIPVQQ